MIFITGPTQSGKTTMARELAQNSGASFFSTGEFFRKNFSKMSDNDKKSIASTDRSEDMEQKIRQEITSIMASSIPHVVEGFPRSAEQVDFLASLQEKGPRRRILLLYLNISLPEAVDRAAKRSRGEEDGIDFLYKRWTSSMKEKPRLLKAAQDSGFVVFELMTGNI